MVPEMQKSPPPSVMFVLRFWLERSISGVRWRGRIEHIPGGSHSDFLTMKKLLKFLRCFEICLDDIGRFIHKEGTRE